VAMGIAIEMIKGLQYKLRMMGVPIEGPCNEFCDNNAVVINSNNPESTLMKKHTAINYHCTRGGPLQQRLYKLLRGYIYELSRFVDKV
jgi:hypothetical protein